MTAEPPAGPDAADPQDPSTPPPGATPGGASEATPSAVPEPSAAPDAPDPVAADVVEGAPTQVLPTPGYAAPPVWPPPGAPAPQAAPSVVPAPGLPPASSPAGYPAAPPPSYPGAYPPAAYPPAYPQGAKTSTNAIVGLVLAILSWAICPVVPAIVALFLAHASTREIEESGGMVGGSGINTATRIISWINIGVWGSVLLIFAAFTLVFIVIGLATSPS